MAASRSTGSEGDARKYSLLLLGYRSRSEKELSEKLEKKGFSGDVISTTIASLKESGLLDDHALAENLARQAFQGRLLGVKGARAFMFRRGISPDIIDAVLERDEDIELERAEKLLDKKMKFMKNYLSLPEKRRLWNLFIRKGYAPDTIRKLFRNYKFSEEDQS